MNSASETPRLVAARASEQTARRSARVSAVSTGTFHHGLDPFQLAAGLTDIGQGVRARLELGQIHVPASQSATGPRYEPDRSEWVYVSETAQQAPWMENGYTDGSWL